MRLLALMFMLLMGCDAASSDYPTVIEARSAAAEWAKVNALAQNHQLTATYTRTMREEARTELATAAAAFSDPQSPQAKIVQALLAMPPDASPGQLQAHADKLQTIEDELAVS